MIWRSLICFSLALTCCAGATIRGEVALTNVSGHHAKHVDASGVVIWLEALPGEAPLPQPTPIRAQMLQKNKTFLPHVLAVPAGSVIDFPNDDPIFHNAFSNYNGQIFDIGLYPPGSSRSVKFRRVGVVRVFCNIHSFMSAVIVVLPSPYYAESNEDGSFEVTNVPKGTYRMEVYYEKATEQTLSALARTVTVTGATEDIGSIAISESGYLPIPHLNKFGKQYPETTDPEAYPGARP